MTIPDFQSMMRPVLALHADGLPHTAADVRNDVAVVLGVTEEERQVPLPSGRTTRYANRVAWAVTHMVQALLLERPARGVTQIRPRGREVLAKYPDRVDMSVLVQFPGYVAFRSRSRPPLKDRDSGSTGEEPTREVSPSEAITEVVDEAHAAVAGYLLARILLRPPQFLERLVLKLLVSMGYGGLEAVTEHLGGPGDQGLDGLIRQDLLGLDVVYVQAKRYAPDRRVGRPDIQGFAGGAAVGAGVTGDGFIATSSFSADARRYADRINARLVLIDGPELARLMVEHNCGVRVEETFVLKQVDEDFFDET